MKAQNNSQGHAVEPVWLGAIALVALAVRIVLALQPHVLQADEGAYVWLGRNLVTGRGFTFIGIPEVHYTPLFPALCGLVYLLLGSLEAASKVCFVVFGTGLVVPVYLLARAIYGVREARLAGLLVAALPAVTSHVLYWGSMSEPLYLFLLFWGLWLVWRAWHEGGWKLHAGAACLLSLAYLTRPEGLIFVGAGLAFLALVKGRQVVARWRELAAYLAVFALFAAPYVAYLHRETGAWMLTGKVWTAYVQDRALANRDWITFDRMTWGLDATGEVLYHSKERFSRSLESYIAAEPAAFVRGMADNARTLPSILIAREGIPRPLLAFLALAFFLQPWTRARARAEAFLGGAAMVPLVTFWPVLFSVRFLQPVYPVAMIWAARGIVALGDWLAETARTIVQGDEGDVGTRRHGGGGGRGGDQERITLPHLWRVSLWSWLVALPAAAVVLYMLSLHPGLVRQGAAHMKFNYKAAGEWLQAHTTPEAVVMSRGAIAAIHAEREWAPFPHASWAEIVAYAKRRGAGYLVVTEQEIRQFQPHLELLLDETRPPAELEHLHTLEDGQGRTIIYRFKH